MRVHLPTPGCLVNGVDAVDAVDLAQIEVTHGPVDWTGYGKNVPGTSIIRLLQPAGKAAAESLKKEDPYAERKI